MGHLPEARGKEIWLVDDLMPNLERADNFARELKKGIDRFIHKSGIEALQENQPEMEAGYQSEVFTHLNLVSIGVTTILWATGYDFDFSWVKFQIWDRFSYPKQDRGVTKQPGLFF